MLARTLTPEFYDLQESGIIHWWENRNADKDILSPSKFYTDKTYFGTHLHRALIHWPPKKSPEFEKDIVRLGNFIMLGYILVFLYFSSCLLAILEVSRRRKTMQKILKWVIHMRNTSRTVCQRIREWRKHQILSMEHRAMVWFANW